MSDPDLPLLSTGELLRGIVDEVTESRARDYVVMQKIAELNRRGAATELGYKNLALVLRDAVRWDKNTATRWVEQAAKLSGEITPTGSEITARLPITATAAAEGALSIEHVAVVAEAMQTLPADREAQLVDYARQFEPTLVRALGKKLIYGLFQNDPEPTDPSPSPPAPVTGWRCVRPGTGW